ncbi:VOC family protein [Leucobacter denitrificans]|uniref:VOC family protein n=1 Tax=Leucobacter denitrificans TaxID=683042 RepID=A0A7G9S6B5_9MICO|nr:VOC family protein [Leucobacter denitrificans]QNN63390.1 VOC family protein [Leucobacter denitrificans]
MSHVPEHHSINYVEITVTDLERAKQFYTNAFNWVFKDYGPTYAAILGPSGFDEVGGLLVAEKPRPTGGPFVLLYSANLDASAAAIVAAGGEVTEGPYEFPGGRRLHFTDPSGNELGVWAEH